MMRATARRTAAALLAGAVVLSALPAQAQDRWIGRDKALHASIGAALAAAGYAGTSRLSDDRKPRVLVGLTLGIGANAGKELRDRRTGGDPSWKDFTAGLIGAVAGTTVAWLIDRAASGPQPVGTTR